MALVLAVFKELQKESEFQRKEWFRKQGRTHTLFTTHECSEVLSSKQCSAAVQIYFYVFV